MTAKELSEMLSGREYGMEITKAEEQQAADAGLVVVYGYSDDNVELRGAIDAEIGAYEDTTIYITPDGLLEGPTCSDAEDCTCPYFVAARNAARTITAIWRDGKKPSRVFSTDIPHETFTIFEDGELFCEGIVFSMTDVVSAPPNTPLTLEELLKMNGEPIFAITTAGSTWALVDVQKDKSVLLWSGQGCSLEAEIVFLDGHCYRQKPEAWTK